MAKKSGCFRLNFQWLLFSSSLLCQALNRSVFSTKLKYMLYEIKLILRLCIDKMIIENEREIASSGKY